MAVLIEAVSIVIQIQTLEAKYPGGLEAYRAQCPSDAFCMDDSITCAHFLVGHDAATFIECLRLMDFCYILENGEYVDIAVVDQIDKLTRPCAWLETATVTIFKPPMKLMMAHIKGEVGKPIETPSGWAYETSLSKQIRQASGEEVEERLRFLRHEDGWDIFFDRVTGEECYVEKRTKGRMADA